MLQISNISEAVEISSGSNKASKSPTPPTTAPQVQSRISPNVTSTSKSTDDADEEVPTNDKTKVDAANPEPLNS